eukprot:2024759-Pleurochrysis_carterae.AAC.1
MALKRKAGGLQSSSRNALTGIYGTPRRMDNKEAKVCEDEGDLRNMLCSALTASANLRECSCVVQREPGQPFGLELAARTGGVLIAGVAPGSAAAACGVPRGVRLLGAA